MSERPVKPVANALSGRREILQLLLIGVLLALATNILATAVTSAVPGFVAAGSGALLLLLVGGFAVRHVLAACVVHRSFDAALLLSSDELQVHSTEIYEFSEDMARLLNAVFRENEAFAQAWRREPVTEHWDVGANGHGIRRRPERAGLRLLHEALEAWLVQELATHLTDYYADLDESDLDTVTLEREHVPRLLLENRVLNLLSTPVGDRPAFLQECTPAGCSADHREMEGVVYGQFGPGGVMYERFELVLPKGSKLSREPTGALTIDTPRLHLSLQAKYEGFTANLPIRLFSRFYRVDPFEVASLLIRFELTGRVKALAMVSGRGWDLYRWVDSFVDRIEDAASLDTMMQRIRWSNVEALLIAQDDDRKGGGAGT
ncbi:MAG: hypothetical protein U0821_07760 [Chloroflexota bacterium]